MSMSTPALLVIDVQQGFDAPVWGQRNQPHAEQHIALLISAWRTQGLPVLHVQHSSRKPDSPLNPKNSGWHYKPEALPLAGETQFNKLTNSAFIGTGLEHYLRENNILSLVIVGLTTDHCVSTSVRMAGNLGFEVRLVSDATATFERTGPNGEHYSAEQVHQLHLASLHQEFCQVLDTQAVLQWLASRQNAAIHFV